MPRRDVAAGGDRSAMTILVVAEAAEPRARAQVSAEAWPGISKGDIARGGGER